MRLQTRKAILMEHAGARDHLVVIGSSAGGIDALSRVVATLPEDFPAAVVLAQHLDPGRPSQLVSILERHSTLPVQAVTEKATLVPGTILVVPSNEQATVTRNEITLESTGGHRPSPSIDHLFSSAAEAYGEHLTAVILTGTGSDGAAGARLVKQAGGTVVIENPETAEYPSMPQSLSPTLVDFSADLDDMGLMLHRLLTEDLPVGQHQIEPGGELAAFLDDLRRQSNIDFSRYRTPTILRRLQRRMVATRSETLREYQTYLSENRGEYQSLISSFLIKVTEFFRDESLFNYLRESVLPELLRYARQNDNQLRFWSAGCATGEEAYSLAILLAELLGDEIHQFNIRIFATDLDMDAIEYARRGVYPELALARMSDEMIERYFTEYGSEYEVKKVIRSMVIFGQHDLGRRSPFPRIDLVLCRNVLIYFTEELQQRALQTFAFSIRHDGFLALGKSESAGSESRTFVLENAEAKVYRRHGEVVVMPLQEGGHVPTGMPMNSSQQGSIPWSPSRSSSRVRDHQHSTEQLVPFDNTENLLFNLPVGMVMINDSYDILMINNVARRQLGIHGVAVGADLIHLTRNVELSELRDLIDRAFREEGQIRADLTISSDATSDPQGDLQVSAYQQAMPESERNAVVLVLSDVSELVRKHRGVEEELRRERQEREELNARANHLARTNLELYESNSELASANEQLRHYNQQLLVAHEEAQVSAEEIETLNEELQATNEELETLNEELQATVEELNATNEDMQARTAELQEMTTSLEEQRRTSEAQRARLEAVLSSMGDAVLVVTQDGTTSLMNPDRCRQMFGEDLEYLIAEDDQGNRLEWAHTPLARAQGDREFSMQFIVNFPNAGRRWFEASAQPIQSADYSSSCVLVIRDITDSSVRRLQEEFMSVASHELRTPLTALRGYLQMLQGQLGGVDERAQRRVTIALAMVDRMVRLVSELLDVGRLQTGKFELVFEEIELGSLVHQTVDLAQSMTTDHEFVIDVPETTMTITADPMRVQQVLLNLISNAISYSPDNSQIEVRARLEDEQAVLEVRDYGIGIPDDTKPQIFTQFFQGSRPLHAEQRGLGLGLFITKEIVDAHDGHVELESACGEGTTFKVCLPRDASRATLERAERV
jgi:two-component system, chemotaxis family, CheB/CheR fusion protein